MKNLLHLLSIVILLIYITRNCQSQGIGINSTGSNPDPSAMLDVRATNMGMLVPRVALTGTTSPLPITSPANGLLVFDTVMVSDVTPGFYYWDGNDSKWVRLISGLGATGVTGATGINGTTGSVGAIGSTGTVGITGATGNINSTGLHIIGERNNGGIIFYLSSETSGLIVTTTNISTGIRWHNGSFVITGATGTAVGTGQSNTSTIVSAQGAGSYAASICANLTLAGYSDWYLPSKDELNQIYLQKTAGGISMGTGAYWTSSEADNDIAWYQSLSNGSQNTASKGNTFNVRCVRSF